VIKPTDLINKVDGFRLDVQKKLDRNDRSILGQFMTPPETARLMASMFEVNRESISLLDAGAGVGSLTAAFVEQMCHREHKPKQICVTAYEIDQSLVGYLSKTLDHCANGCRGAGIEFESKIIEHDFIDEGVSTLRQRLLRKIPHFDCAILNPPYKKISSNSPTRSMLREVGIETSNLYTAFLSIALMLLSNGGELVAISPRSFCNGPYFKPFRKFLLETLTIKRLHVFESRRATFRDDQVLQENIIVHGSKTPRATDTVVISTSEGSMNEVHSLRTINRSQLVEATDNNYFIRIVGDETGAAVAREMQELGSSLQDLDIEVSTGRVVDFRAIKFLRDEPGRGTVPLIYPRNLDHGFVVWPKAGGNKPHAIANLPGAHELLVSKGTYVLVKRFSSKEEKRRIVAAIYDPKKIASEKVGFENHINYFHRRGKGLPNLLAKGLTAFLNSSPVDLFFRQFNGHTQVNATDLRSLKYPTAAQLESLGSKIGKLFPDPQELDEMVAEEVFSPHASKYENASKGLDSSLNY